MPAQDRVRSKQGADFVQAFPAENSTFDCQSTSLVIVQQNTFSTELLFEHLILSSEILNDFLLLPIHPASQNHNEQLPRLKDKRHRRPAD
jgi:hypothetical protein